MAGKNAFREMLHLKAAGTAADVLQFPQEGPVERGRRYHITHIAWEDEDTNWTQTRIYVDRSGSTHRFVDDASVTKAIVYALDDEIVLTEGERFCLYFSGATSGDDLRVWLQGFWVGD